MQYRQHISFLEDELPQDDIDRLFSKLQPIEPPPSFIARVLNEVPAQAMSASLFSQPQPVMWDTLDIWVVRNRRRKLC